MSMLEHKLVEIKMYFNINSNGLKISCVEKIEFPSFLAYAFECARY